LKLFHVIETYDSKFFVTANVRDLVKKGKLTQDKAEKTLSMLKGVLDYSDFKEVDMVIEVGSKHILKVKFGISNLQNPCNNGFYL
jgi:enoyl-CoA hydratase/3-hydroxyacyl-CoA dehydrogenase